MQITSGVEGLNEWGKEGRCVCVGGGWGGVIRDCGKWFVDNTGQKVPLFKGKCLQFSHHFSTA